MPLLVLPFTTRASPALGANSPGAGGGAAALSLLRAAPALEAFTSARWKPLDVLVGVAGAFLPFLGALADLLLAALMEGVDDDAALDELAAAPVLAPEAGAPPTDVVTPAAGGAAAAPEGAPWATGLISLTASNCISHSGLGASDATATSFVSGAKHSISTFIVQMPSVDRERIALRPGWRQLPLSLSPWVAVTVAPGSGRPPNFLTTPWCSEATRADIARQAKTQILRGFSRYCNATMVGLPTSLYYEKSQFSIGVSSA